MKNYSIPIRKNTSRRKPNYDYLKYWRTIRYWIKAKYKLTTPDIEMLLFLYSENMFTKTKFKRFEQIMSWDVNRFDKLLRDDWIHVWRKRKGKEATLYELTYKSKSRKRPGVHSKNNFSKVKHSKNYKKKYRGQGR